MRIISQDGMIDVPYEMVKLNIEWHGCGNGKDYVHIVMLFREKHTSLAIYSSEAKARKAMEMLREAFKIYDWIKTTGYSDELKILARQGPLEVFDEVTSSYFQFPADDEVEV